MCFNWETQLKNFKEGGKFVMNDNKDEVIEFVNKWMRSHAIALQKAKLKIIGMQDDDD